MTQLRRLLREPLVQFVLAAAMLYALHALWQGTGAGNDGQRIVVDRATLLRYVQYRAQTFDPATFEAYLDALPAIERRRLIDEYVREEVLYREALALGLQRDDNVMRLRLVQKMSFLLERPAPQAPAEAELEAYYAAHQQEYVVEPSWTFAHVFVAAETQGEQHPGQAALRMLKQLNADGARFNDAPRYSDRFPYLLNYVERTPDFIEAHFGAEFRAALDALPVSVRWQGPLRSTLGWHLLLITARQPGRVPALAEIHAEVVDDYRRARAAEILQQSEQELIGRYRVVVGDLARRSQP
jgi:hypothetical protein